MSVVSATLSGRRAAERDMLDAIRIKRLIGLSEPAEGTGKVEPLYDIVYDGKGTVTTYEPHEEKPDAAEHEYVLQRYTVKIPVLPAGSATPRVGDIAEIVKARLDPALAGREGRISARLHKSHATAYRYATTFEEA